MQNACVERNPSFGPAPSSFKVRPGYHVTIPQEELATYPHQIQVAVPMTEAALSQDNLFLLATEVLRVSVDRRTS